jgi:hypothetical protein
MGQYFRAVNVTKREYVDAWDLGGVAKLWEWCANRCAGVFPYLLRKSTERGGGDIHTDAPHYAGRWAGDRVYLVGDYDESGLFQTARREFTNISSALADEYNAFIEIGALKLKTQD